MKNIKLKLTWGGSALIMGLLLGWLIFGGTTPSAGEDEHIHSETTIYTCSMHPSIRQSEPGDCPICGMDLIPVEEGLEEGVDPNAVTMSQAALQLANVRTQMVDYINPVKKLRLNGKVQEDERRIFSQSSHIPGRVERLMVNFTGEYIRRGQVIAYVYSPELVTAQEELFTTYKIRQTQPNLYSASVEKLKNWKLSDQQIDEIIASGELKKEFPIISEVAGYITSKKVNRGDYIQKGQVIFEVVDLSRVWVLFDIYESDLPWIDKGDKIEFNVASLPSENFEGEISFIDPVIDARTRVAKARVELINKGLKLKPEMFVSGILEAELDETGDKLTIPKTSVMWTGERSVVYIKTEGGENRLSFILREITLGPSLGDEFIVESGLSEGEEIVSNGTFSIDAAAQLAGKPSMMNPEGNVSKVGKDQGYETPNIKAVKISKSARSVLQPIYQEYLKLKNALVNDQFEMARTHAVELQHLISQVSMTVFEGPSHEVWMERSANINKSLDEVDQLAEIATLREKFQGVSDQMIALAQAFDPLEETLYIQYCPMADQSRGAFWLSTEEEVLNPYFGEVMLKCGEVRDSIK